MIIPKTFKSAGWCSKLNTDEKAALLDFMVSFHAVKDALSAGNEMIFDVDSNASSCLNGLTQLFFAGCYSEVNHNKLTTQMSTFLEGFRAGARSKKV